MNEQLGTTILVVGVILAIVGQFWLIIRAFRTSWGWGIGVFVPVIGPIVYILAYPTRAKPPIAVILLGAIVGFSPILINQLFSERQAKVPLQTEKQIVTRGAKNPMFDEMLAKTDVESASFAREEFTDELAERLSTFSKLKTLDLSDSAITDQTLTVIAKLPSLEVLRVARVKGITDDGMKKLLDESKSVKEIDARATAVTVETLREWRKGNPERKSNPK